MNESEIIENLKTSVLFEQAPDSLLREIAKITRIVTIDAGERLIEKGEMGDAMYVVCDGSVKVHDGDLLLSRMGKGSAFGEMAALDGDIRTASITALTATRLIQLERDDLFALIDREPRLAKSLIHFLCQRGKNIISDVTERSLKLRTLEREFEIARSIQSGFLPDSVPKVPGWDIAAYFRAAKEVAGDFYDIFDIGDGKVALIVGDVCGKGVGAALFMALFRSLLRFSLLSSERAERSDASKDDTDHAGSNIGRILVDSMALTNNYVAETHAEACMFSTIFAAVLNPADGSLTYVNAGHEAPVVFDKNGIKDRLVHSGPAAGLFAEAEFAAGETILLPGETLLIFTDGVPEAVDSEDNQFTTERLLDVLRRSAGAMDEALSEVVSELSRFTKGLDQFDDITLLGIRRKG